MKKGELIFWEISDFNTTKEKIEDMGFGDLVPRNDYRTAAVKAIRRLTKGKERMYRKFNDNAKSVSFGVFLENTFQDDISLEKDMIVHVNKSTGRLDFSCKNQDAIDTFKTDYEHAQKTLDATQFRALVLRVIRRECYGISMRKGGGIYFVDSRFEKTKGRLEELFSVFSQTCKLHLVPIYDDKGTVEAIEHAASQDITTEINAIFAKVKESMKKGSLTRRGLDGRIKEADKIIEKVAVHEGNLRTQLHDVELRVKGIKAAFEKLKDDATRVAMDPEDFVSELEAL